MKTANDGVRSGMWQDELVQTWTHTVAQRNSSWHDTKEGAKEWLQLKVL